MRIRRKDLEQAVSSEILSASQARALWEHLGGPPSRPRGGAPEDAGSRPSSSERGSLTETALGFALAVALWCALVLLVPSALGWKPSTFERALLSALVGVVLLGAGFRIDGRAPRARAGPFYVAGLAAVLLALATAGRPGALSASEDIGSPVAAIAAGTALVLLGLALRRRSFASFGALALAGAAGQIADETLDGAYFSLALLGIALGLGLAALAWRRAGTRAGDALVARMPAQMRAAFEVRRRPAPGD